MIKIAALGGKARIEMHGNPGTPAGRKKGGQRSASLQARTPSNFKTLQKIKRPKYSVNLAEVIGAFVGDGHVGLYQASIVTNSETDLAHAQYLQALIQKVFGVSATLSYRKDCRACIIRISSKQACDILEALGMPRGNKLEKGLTIPNWIDADARFKSAFVRGLFDTDGTVYLDRHIVKGKEYASNCIAITSASKALCDSVYEFFAENGYTPTRWGRNVRLRRKSDVQRFMREIGSRNPKHLSRTGV